MTPANDNAPHFTPGLDGLRMWINGKVVAEGLSVLQTMSLLKSFSDRKAA